MSVYKGGNQARGGGEGRQLAEVEGEREGACAGLNLEVWGGLRERSRGCSCQSSGSWNSLPLSFHPPPSLDRPYSHARPPSPPSSRSPSPFLALSSRTILLDKL